jgi:predicted nuclease of predicted toxin-antitoxin system
MRLLANENFPRVAVEALRALGHDVPWVAEDCPSARDESVLELAVRGSRVLLTQDKDFGELAFRQGLPSRCGIVLFRIVPIPGRVAEIARKVLGQGADFSGKFVVVEEGRIRERTLPAGTERR